MAVTAVQFILAAAVAPVESVNVIPVYEIIMIFYFYIKYIYRQMYVVAIRELLATPSFCNQLDETNNLIT